MKLIFQALVIFEVITNTFAVVKEWEESVIETCLYQGELEVSYNDGWTHCLHLS